VRVIIIADLTGDPKSECLEDVADLVGGMKSPSGRFGLDDVTIYADVETLRHDLSEGHEHVSCSLPTLGWGPASLDAGRGIVRQLCVSGESRAVCVDPTRAERKAWRTTTGEEDALRHLGRDRVHILTGINEHVTRNVTPCDCAKETP